MSKTAGLTALIGTYTQDSRSEGIYTIDVDPAAGAMDIVRTTGVGENPSFFATHPTGDTVYATNSVADGKLVALDLDPDTAELAIRNTESVDASGPCHVSVEPDGEYALTANYRGSSVSMVPIEEDGSLGPVSDVVEHSGSGPDPDRQTEPHPHSINPGPDGRLAYVPDLGTDEVVVYEIDRAADRLRERTDLTVSVHDGAGPRHFDVHPDGDAAYLINELDSTLTVFERNTGSGELSERQTISTIPEGFDEVSYCADVHVHPSGEFVYGSNRGHDSIVVFAIDGTTGEVEAVQHESTRGDWPRNFALTPDGSLLFAENRNSDDVYAYEVDESTGRLTPLDESLAVPAPSCMRFLG